MSQFNPTKKSPSEVAEQIAKNICLQIDNGRTFTSIDIDAVYLNYQAIFIGPIRRRRFHQIYREVRAKHIYSATFHQFRGKNNDN